MIKLKTGISTSLDFIRAMKERGQEVKPSLPAEVLRDQLDALSDDIKVTFKSNNETILQAVNDSEEPTDKFNITLEYQDHRNLSGIYNILVLPNAMEFNPDMVTESQGMYLFGEHAVVTLNDTLIPNTDYGIEETENGKVLMVWGDTFEQVITENNGLFLGVNFNVHVDEGVGLLEDKTSNAYDVEFTYGDSIDGSEYQFDAIIDSEVTTEDSSIKNMFESIDFNWYLDNLFTEELSARGFAEVNVDLNNIKDYVFMQFTSENSFDFYFTQSKASGSLDLVEDPETGDTQVVVNVDNL